MTIARYWCFDEGALECALTEWVGAASGNHPEAHAAAESAAAAVRSFLNADEARRHKLLTEIRIAKERDQ